MLRMATGASKLSEPTSCAIWGGEACAPSSLFSPMPVKAQDVLADMSFSPQHSTTLHSTNRIKRLDGEVKRGTEVVCTFPNEAAITRIAGAILLQKNEWVVQRARSMTLRSMPQKGHGPPVTLPTMVA